MQICTGNPNQLWAYDEPARDGSNRHVVMSEAEILETYKVYWIEQMTKINKQSLITDENCIDDWIIVNWAYKVESREENAKL